MREKKCTAVVLAAGRGTRMGTSVQKQYLELHGRPVLFYSLRVFQDSPLIDEIVLVTGAEEITFCRDEIVGKYGFDKVKAVVPGGKERYHSVYRGLCEITDGIVFIHDGARPFVNEEMIQRAYRTVLEERACVVGMPVKDTIKIVDENQFARTTPNRAFVWMVQTPQVFEVSLVREAYEKLMESGETAVTDDAMVVEKMTGHPVRLVEGSYQNIKITTSEDLDIARIFVEKEK